MDIKEYLRQEIEKNDELAKVLEYAKLYDGREAEVAAHASRIAAATASYKALQESSEKLSEEIAEKQKQFDSALNAAVVEQVNLKAQYDRMAAEVVANHQKLEADVAAKLAQAQADADAEVAKLKDGLDAKKTEYAAEVAALDEKIQKIKGAV
jgi:hypothetical protein